jgi:hypothetical protein
VAHIVIPSLYVNCWGQTHGSGSSAARVASQDPSDAPDYYEIIKSPLCLEQMLEKVDAAKYPTLPVRPPATVATLRALPDVLSCVLFSHLFIVSTQAFLADVQLIRANAEEYNPRDDPHFLISKVREACSTLLLVLGLND